METLGARIKRLRKEKKITQSALVGDRLTKGMLSLIENDKAKPSMESLTYIAQQLHVQVEQLMAPVSQDTLRALLADIKKQGGFSYPYNHHQIEQNFVKIQHYVAQMPHNFEGALLLRYYAMFGEILGKETAPYLEQAMQIFYDSNAMDEWLDTKFWQINTLSHGKKYHEALQHGIALKQECEQQQYVISTEKQIHLLFVISALHLAVNNLADSYHFMLEAYDISMATNQLLRIDDILRVLILITTLENQHNEASDFLQKLYLFSCFKNDDPAWASYYIMKAHLAYLHKDYTEMLRAAKQLTSFAKEDSAFHSLSYYYLGTAHYLLGHKKQAFQAFDHINEILPNGAFIHPYDRMGLCELLSYKARLLHEYGNAEALPLITALYEEAQSLTSSLQVTAIIEEAYALITAPQ